MPVTKDATAPYAPASGILSIIERHRNKGLPSPIDADTLARSGVSNSLIPRTMQALTTLDLIDEDGNPTDILEGLRLASEGDFKNRMIDWLRHAYSDALQFIEPEADETAIRDAFRSYKPVGQQSRMVTLFTGLFTAAGLREGSERRPIQGTNGKPRKQRAEKRVVQSKEAEPKAREEHSAPVSSNMGQLPPAVAGLLHSLPLSGTGWSKRKREQFLNIFGATLDFYIPVISDEDDQNNKVNSGVDSDDT